MNRRGRVHDAKVRALRWIAAYKEAFWPRGAPFDSLRAQRVAELAWLLYVLRRTERSPELQELSAWLLATAERAAFQDQAPRNPRAVVLFLSVHALARAEGRAPPSERAWLRRALHLHASQQRERTPHRAMELDLVARWADVPIGGAARTRGHLRASMLSRPVNAFSLDTAGAYILTHLLMYLTDFGARGDVELPFARDVRDTLAHLCVYFAHRRNWDVCGELLLCWDAARLPRDTVYGRTWRALLHAQRPNGALDGPVGAPSHADAASTFAHAYHTTLVLALACHAAAARAPHERRDLTPHGREARHFKEAANTLAAHERGALLATWAWLTDRVHALPREDAPPKAPYQLTLALWICFERLRTLGTPVPLRSVLQHLRARISPTFLPEHLTAAVQAAFVWRAVRQRHDALESLLSMLRQVAGAWSRPLGVADELALVLHAAAVLPAPPPPSPKPLAARLLRGSLRAEVSEITRWTTFAFHATMQGTRSVAPLRQDAVAVLCAWAHERLTRSDVTRAAALMRAAAYLGAPASSLAKARHALLNQQRADGSFGLFDVEPDAPLGATTFPAAWTAHLPATLAALTALAELAPDRWRLLRALTAPNGTASVRATDAQQRGVRQ